MQYKCFRRTNGETFWFYSWLKLLIIFNTLDTKGPVALVEHADDGHRQQKAVIDIVRIWKGKNDNSNNIFNSYYLANNIPEF